MIWPYVKVWKLWCRAPYVSLQIVKCRKAREDSRKVKSALLSRFLPFRKAEKGKLMFQFYLKILLFPTNSGWVKIYPWNLWKSSCIRGLLLVILHVKLWKSASKALIKKNSEVPWAGFNLLRVLRVERTAQKLSEKNLSICKIAFHLYTDYA